MNPATRHLLLEAEALSQKPIHVVFDAELPILARVQIARDGASQHVLVVRPGPTADYAIANQLGFVTRHFSLPKVVQVDFAATPRALSHAATLVNRLLRPDNASDDAALLDIAQGFMQWALSVAARV